MSIYVNGEKILTIKNAGDIFDVTSKKLPSESDLDNLKPGIYTVEVQTNKDIRNYPYTDGTNGLLIVFKRNNIGALVEELIGNDGRLWIRTGSGDPFIFGDWIPMARANEVESLKNRIINLENKISGGGK